MNNENEHTGINEGMKDSPVRSQSPAPRKGRKKVKDIFCGLSELQVVEIYRALCFSKHVESINPGLHISSFQSALSIAAKPGRDIYFTDSSPLGFHYLTFSENTSEGISNSYINKQGGGKYLRALGAALSVKGKSDAVVIMETTYNRNEAAELFELMLLNEEHKFPMVALIRTGDEPSLERIKKAYKDIKFLKIEDESIAHEYDIAKEAVEHARKGRGLIIIEASVELGDAILKNTEKALTSNKILTKEEAADLKQLVEDDAKMLLDAKYQKPAGSYSKIDFTNTKGKQGYYININNQGLELLNSRDELPTSDTESNEEFKTDNNNAASIDDVEKHSPSEDNDNDAHKNIQLTDNKNTEPAELYKEGEDLTILFFGNGSNGIFTEDLLEEIGKEDIDAEIIVSSSSFEIPEDMILESITKTGKVLLLIESPSIKSYAAEAGFSIADKGFNLLDAPVKRVMLSSGNDSGLIINSCRELAAY